MIACYVPLDSRGIPPDDNETKYYPFGYLLLFVVFVLPVLILIFVALLSDETAEEDVPATQINPPPSEKYPKDLITTYRHKYSHNPRGVLEFHISRKMKEGKTREQAIKELEKALA